MRLGQLYRTMRDDLRTAFASDPHATPELDAKLLIAHALSLPAHAPMLDPDRMCSKVEVLDVRRFIERRIEREPVARIVGEWDFWGLPFTLNAATLVPRPETEGIVDGVLDWVDAFHNRDTPLTIVDIGTGSGAILISLLTCLPKATGVATDISEEALSMAVGNAQRHAVDARFLPVISDYGKAVDGYFDVIVSNPPYIAPSERESLMVEVKEHDPSLALFTGRDGYESFEEIIPWAFDHLSQNGFCMVEHGHEQFNRVATIAKLSGFKRIECVFDLSGIGRFTKLGKKATDSG